MRIPVLEHANSAQAGSWFQFKRLELSAFCDTMIIEFTYCFDRLIGDIHDRYAIYSIHAPTYPGGPYFRNSGVCRLAASAWARRDPVRYTDGRRGRVDPDLCIGTR